MRTLVFCGDIWHPAHLAREGLSGLEGRGFEFDWLEDAGHWQAEQIAQYPLIVFSKANAVSETDDWPWMTDEIQKNLVEHIRRGMDCWLFIQVRRGMTNGPGYVV